MSSGLWAVAEFLAWGFLSMIAAYIYAYLIAKGFYTGKLGAWKDYMDNLNLEGESDGKDEEG